MQKVKVPLSSRLIQIGFIILGVVIGIAFGYGFVVLDEAGAFGGGSWKELKSPLQFEHISGATTLTVWAKTKEDKLYKQTYCLSSDSGCNKWIEAKDVSVDSREEYDSTTITKNTCTPEGIKYPLDPQDNVVECSLSIRYFGIETKDIVYHALLSDGTIWVWSSSGPWYVGLGMFILLISPIIGLVLGLLMYRNFQKTNETKLK